MSRIDDARALLADRLPWLAPAVERLGFTEDPLAASSQDEGHPTCGKRHAYRHRGAGWGLPRALQPQPA